MNSESKINENMNARIYKSNNNKNHF